MTMTPTELARFNMIEQQVRPWNVADAAGPGTAQRGQSASSLCPQPTKAWHLPTWRSR